MATALCNANVAVVVDRKEDVGDLCEVGEGGEDLAHVGLLHEEEGHAGTEEDDAGLGILGESLALEILFPKGDVVVGEPVMAQGLNIFVCKADIVVAKD